MSAGGHGIVAGVKRISVLFAELMPLRMTLGEILLLLFGHMRRILANMLLQNIELLLRWFFVNPINRWKIALTKEARNRFICGNHQILDQSVGRVSISPNRVRGYPVIIENNKGLGNVEIEASAFKSPFE